jgi:hypothetical protein
MSSNYCEHSLNLGVVKKIYPCLILELEAIHASAPATAVIYVSSVLAIYLLGLIIIFMHHMNTAYGPWIW